MWWNKGFSDGNKKLGATDYLRLVDEPDNGLTWHAFTDTMTDRRAQTRTPSYEL